MGYQLTQRGRTISFFELHGAGLAPMGVLHASRPPSLEMLERASSVAIGNRGVRARIADVADLIGLEIYVIDSNPKRYAKDWNDIQMLADRFRETLDCERVEAYLAKLGRREDDPSLPFPRTAEVRREFEELERLKREARRNHRLPRSASTSSRS